VPKVESRCFQLNRGQFPVGKDKPVLLWIVDLAIPVVWAFAMLMVGEHVFDAAQWLFVAGNVICAARIVFTYDSDDELRVATVIFVLLMCIGLSYVEWKFVDWRRNVALAAVQPESEQTAFVLTPTEGEAPSAPSTSYGILPPTPSVTPTPSTPKPATKPKATPPPQPKPTEKPVQPQVFPVIAVADTQVTLTASTNKFQVVIFLMNTGNAPANAHVTTATYITQSGIQSLPGPIDERDIAFALQPFRYQITAELGFTAQGAADYTSGVSIVTVDITVSYPDRDGTTVYHYKGAAVPASAQLNELSSDYEGPTKN
jgi:hypothetical protein